MQNLDTKNAFLNLGQVIWKHAKGFRKRIVVYVTLAILAMLVDLCIPLLIAKLMNTIQTGSPNLLLETLKILALYFALGCVFWMFHGPSRVIETGVAFKLKEAFQGDLLKKITGLPLSWHKQHVSGEIIDQINRATDALKVVVEGSFEVIHLLVRAIGALFLLGWLMPESGLCVLIACTLTFFIVHLFDQQMIKQYQLLNKSFSYVSAGIQDYLSNITTVISLRLEKHVCSEVQKRIAGIYPLVVKTSVTNESKWFLTGRVIEFALILVLFGYVFIQTRANKVIEFGTVFALWRYLEAVGLSFYQFTAKYGDLIMLNTRIAAVDYIDREHKNLQVLTDFSDLPENWQELEIRQLEFKHQTKDSKDENISGVSGVDLRLKRGKSYAFIGASGSGKSTVLSLIRGINQADAGTVFCDSQRQEFGLGQLANITTLIPQEPELFADTVRFNIALAEEATDSEIKEAMKIACFDQVLKQLPQGLETNIAQKGLRLSGGQKQRLAVARGVHFAIKTQSEILLLDEPTSSVDPVTERELYKNILKRFENQIVITAIHKMNLLDLFDQIIVFNEGKITEVGSLDELKEHGKELVNSQNRLIRETEESNSAIQTNFLN
jgi:ATP-binding cassette subfamily B protein